MGKGQTSPGHKRRLLDRQTRVTRPRRHHVDMENNSSLIVPNWRISRVPMCWSWFYRPQTALHLATGDWVCGYLMVHIVITWDNKIKINCGANYVGFCTDSHIW